MTIRHRIVHLILLLLIYATHTTAATNHLLAPQQTQTEKKCNANYPLTPQRQQFVEHTLTLIKQQNALVQKQKQLLMSVLHQHQSDSSWQAKNNPIISTFCSMYQVNCAAQTTEQIRQQLTLRINTIPAPLVLAQAILESNWGTSRFYRQGHNLFGIHCYKKGCGIVPHGQTLHYFEVTRYVNDAQSVQAYFKTINTSRAYQEFRQLRLSTNDASPLQQAQQLVHTLHPYSELKNQYTIILQKLLRCHESYTNKLKLS